MSHTIEIGLNLNFSHKLTPELQWDIALRDAHNSKTKELTAKLCHDAEPKSAHDHLDSNYHKAELTHDVCTMATHLSKKQRENFTTYSPTLKIFSMLIYINKYVLENSNVGLSRITARPKRFCIWNLFPKTFEVNYVHFWSYST